MHKYEKIVDHTLLMWRIGFLSQAEIKATDALAHYKLILYKWCRGHTTLGVAWPYRERGL